MGLARLEADGTLDPTFNPGNGIQDRMSYACISDNLYALALQADGLILAAGKFATFNGYPIPGLVRLRSDDLNQSGALLFSAPRYSVTETGRVVTVTVKRIWGTNSPVSAFVRTEDFPPYPNAYSAIPATAGLDYVPVTQAVHFAAGDVSDKTVTIPFLDDQLGEYWAEFFLAVLDQPMGDVRFADPAIARVGISENDVGVEFEPAGYRVRAYSNDAPRVFTRILRL